MALRLFIRPALCAAATALGLSLSLGAAAADGGLGTVSTLGDPAHAALLNAGTVLTGLRPDGSMGLDPQTISLAADDPGGADTGVQVAGVTVGQGAAGGAADTETTAGAPSLAALLNAATSASGLGPRGVKAAGITAFAG